jgi:hypothetical protein
MRTDEKIWYASKEKGHLLTVLLVIYFMGRRRERQAIANGSTCNFLLVIYYMGRGREQQAIANYYTCYLFYGKEKGTTGNC